MRLVAAEGSKTTPRQRDRKQAGEILLCVKIRGGGDLVFSSTPHAGSLSQDWKAAGKNELFNCKERLI